MPSYLRHLKPYLKRYRRYMWTGLIAIAATNALAMLVPLVLRRAINRIEHGGDAKALVGDAALIILLVGVAGVFRFLVRRTIIWASRKIEYDLRGDLFAHILRLDAPFFDRTPTGDIITRASSDLEQVRMMVGPGVMQGVNTVMVAAAAIPLMLFLDWRLTVYALVPMPVLAILTNILGGLAHRRFMAIQESFSRLSSSVQETLAGIRVIRAFATEPDRSRRFQGDNREYFGLNMRLVRLWGTYMPLLSTLSGLAVILVVFFGGRAVISGRIDLGTLIAFGVYMAELVWPMIALGWVVSLYQRGTASLKRIAAILETEPTVIDPPPTLALRPEASSTLEFRHLTFSYPGNGNGSASKALDDVSFTITPGETVAIAGPTGSGKSTVVHLLARRYPVADASIFLGGIDANRVTLSEWRSHIAPVAQEPFLFSDTLRTNIAFGNHALGEDDLVAVSERAAFAKDVAFFPREYDTIVGERGITLSGGQKQRATLARALASDADVLVLDDAFSAVDAETEQEILRNLEAQFGRRIVILITHRISTLQRVDRILFLQHGRLVDSGSHDSMLAHGGAYARWVAKEAILEELERM